MLPFSSSCGSSRVVRVFSLLIVLGMAAGAAWWYLRPARREVVALFQVSPDQPALTGNASLPPSRWEWDRLKLTLIAQLKSDYVLSSALRAPRIASLSLLGGKQDPVDWLQHTLQVSFPQDGEVLAIKLVGSSDEESDMVNLVNAVADAFQTEVIGVLRQRKNSDRDLIQRTVNDLDHEISGKYKELEEITRGSENVGNETGRLRQQIDFADLGRIDGELLQLQLQQIQLQATGDEKQQKIVQEKITFLTKRSDELRKRMEGRSIEVPTITARRAEIARLNRQADELSDQLNRRELDAARPDQIMLIQKAVASDEVKTVNHP